MDRSEIDQLLALAATQHELFTIGQAAKIGITVPMLRAARDRGWVRRERNGVYSVGGAGPSRWRATMAAALAAGPKATVSHSTAAMIHKFPGVHSDDIELSITAGRLSLRGVVVHRSTTLAPDDVQERSGVTVTTPIRTIVDLASRFEEPLLAVILDEGAIARLWTVDAIGTRLDGVGRGLTGVATLRRLVAERTGEGNPDSKLEQRVIRVIKNRVAGYTLHHREVLEGQVIEMDLAWVDQKIDGEVDGMGVRSVSRTKFERERIRENILQRNGWRIVHFTDKMNDETIIAQIAPLLGL